MSLSPLQQLERRIWQNPSPGRWERGLRILLAVFRVVNESRIRLFATSLTYSTLLAIVPLLAVLFTLLKSFGIDKFLKQTIHDLLAPMGAAGQEVSTYLSEFIQNAQAGLLGGLGLVFLFYSIFALFRKIEIALNAVWSIDILRNIRSQVLSYLGAIMLTVIVAALALGLNVFFHQSALIKEFSDYPWLVTLLSYAAKGLSIIVTAMMLAIVYGATINTEVNFRAAFSGGLFCTILWLPLTTIFAKIIGYSSNYSLIYSSFAGLIILLVWLQVLWLLFLSGALVSYFVQFPALLKPYGTADLNPAELEHYAHVIIKHIKQHFKQGSGAVHLSELMAKTQLSHRQVHSILLPFLIENVIVKTTHQGNEYLLAKDAALITDDFINKTVRGHVRPKKLRSQHHEAQFETEKVNIDI